MKYTKITTLWAREDQKPHNMIIGKFAKPEFEQLKNHEWIATEKVDGTNVRIIWDGHKVLFQGRTDNSQLPSKLFERLTELFGGEANEQVFEQVFGEANVMLCGEGFGEGIQGIGKKLKPDGLDFILFDVWIEGVWLERENIEDVASKFDIDVVPIVKTGTLQELSDFTANGFDSTLGEHPRSEGIVASPTGGLLSRKGDRIITKLKTKDFDKLK